MTPTPVTLSSALYMSQAEITALGVVDVTLNIDTKLFIDPLLLQEASDERFRDCATSSYRKRFELVIKLLKVSKRDGDKPWKAARKLLTFPEISGTHVGYSKGLKGAGSGTLITDATLASAQEIVGLGIEDPDLFLVLALFEENVGADRISDMATNIALPCLSEFSVRIATSLPLKIAEFQILGTAYTFPVCPHAALQRPLILVPNDIVKLLPTAADWDSISAAAQETEKLRAQVNAQIGAIWEAKTVREKRRFRANALSSRQAFETALSLLKTAAGDAYDVAEDLSGELYPSVAGRGLAEKHPIAVTSYSGKKLTLGDVDKIVQLIVEQFRNVVENNGCWRLLWDEELTKPRKEKASQKLFFAMAKAYCDSNQLDLSPESDAGRGPVDFKISSGLDKVVVELKLSSNTKLLHGYQVQLEIYKTSEYTSVGHFVVLDVDHISAVKLRKLNNLRKRQLEAGEAASSIHVIDATTKASASKT